MVVEGGSALGRQDGLLGAEAVPEPVHPRPLLAAAVLGPVDFFAFLLLASTFATLVIGLPPTLGVSSRCRSRPDRALAGEMIEFEGGRVL